MAEDTTHHSLNPLRPDRSIETGTMENKDSHYSLNPFRPDRSMETKQPEIPEEERERLRREEWDKQPKMVSIEEDPDILHAKVRRLADYLSVESKDVPSFQDKLIRIYNFGKNLTKGTDLQNILWALKSLELKLDAPPFGEKRINTLYRWIVLDEQFNSLKKAKEALEREGI